VLRTAALCGLPSINLKIRKEFLSLLTVFLTFSILLFSVANAKPNEVSVGVYVLNIGKFDLSSGSYTLDFYLSMKCDGNCNTGDFEFLNGRATSIDKIIDKPNEKFYRIQANLLKNLDLKNYPFDEHSLTIEMEDKEATKDDLIYKFDKEHSGVDPLVILVGWELKGWDGKVGDHFYQPYDEIFSRFIFSMNIKRVVLASVIKSFLPVFFMVFVGLLSLLLKADKVSMRLSLNISTLLAAVFFHLNLSSQIPPVGYLTFADKFMITTYIILISILFSGILLMRRTDKKDEKLAERMYRISLYAIPIMTIFLYLLNFFAFL